ncbi:ubiquitin activating enzyme 2 [Actinidia rufa]|uniref:Ubiquitin activating enzyme 2 n=1 Tax=Actinidia rufa TaxID=165716 RepID=A0A7J0E9R9_9ERIC|nr:ubiquitin activating enzyme 2 [Actinidia rufa]
MGGKANGSGGYGSGNVKAPVRAARRTLMRIFTAASSPYMAMRRCGGFLPKNLVVAGVKSVTLPDEGIVELEDPHTGIVASISNDNPALVTCVDDERLEFQDGDLVVFPEVHGMTKLNDGRPRKQLKVLNFKPLQEALTQPGDFLLSDFSKFDRSPLIHLALQALDKFISELGRFPIAGSEEDAQELISLATDINNSSADERLEEIDPKLLRNFAFGAKAVLNPIASMFDCIVGQEVVKACSGKFHPLFQLNFNCAHVDFFYEHFFYFDSVESLPSEILDPSNLKPLNSRYDALISVFGAKLQQFLFRDWNIGQAKSTVAASAAYLINPRLHIEALQNRASPETENVFDDTFWENQSIVINALDNVNARLYNGHSSLDRELCIIFLNPLIVCFDGTGFEDYFTDRVKQLTFTFPVDAVTSNGTPFWSAPKRFPRPLQFSSDDFTQLKAASILRTETFGIPIPDWVKSPKKLADAVNNVIVHNFQPKKDVKIVTDEKATSLSTASIDDAVVINEFV